MLYIYVFFSIFLLVDTIDKQKLSISLEDLVDSKQLIERKKRTTSFLFIEKLFRYIIFFFSLLVNIVNR